MRAPLVVLLMLAVTLAGCADRDGDDGPTGTPTQTPTGTGDPGNTTDPPKASIAIDATGFYPASPALTPARFEVASGTLLTITYTNRDSNPFIGHDLFVDGVDVGTQQLANGQSTTLEFLVTLDPGEYAYYCRIGNHRDQGMEGVMVVT